MPNPTHQKNIVHGNITAGGNVRIGDDYITYLNYFAAQEVKIPHRLTNNIPTNADHILGRATELAQAKDHLAKHQATILFNGIGGIGKTASASKYMALYGSEYKHLAWITVQSTLAEAFTNNAPLLASMQITQRVQAYIEARQLDKAFEYLFHQLNLLEYTLVVIDNANDLDDLDQYKNWFDTANCHFLITSRSQPSEWATVEVDSLPEPEAIALFRKLHPSVSADDETIKNLLSKLFYHTLLIELVAKAGASTGIAFADLETMIETQFIHHQSLNEAPVPTGKHGSVVPNNLKKARIENYIWLIFSQVKGLNEDSKHLLKAMALLPVATPFDLDFLKEHFVFFNIQNPVADLDALTERGWLQKEQAEGQKLYIKIHPLIADVVVEHLNIEVIFAEAYTAKIKDLIDYDNLNAKHILIQKKSNKSFAERLSNLFFKENNEKIAELLDCLGILERNFGFYPKAIAYKERALEIAEVIFEKNHIKIAKYQNNLGWTYHFSANYHRAIELIELGLEGHLKHFGEGNSTVCAIQSNLGWIFSLIGDYNKTVELLEPVLVIALSNLGSEHPVVAIIQSHLGNAYRNLGYHTQAADLLENALMSDIKNFGSEHPEVANKQYNLAQLYYDIGRNADAKKLWQCVYKNDLKNLGAEHPYTIKSKKRAEM